MAVAVAVFGDEQIVPDQQRIHHRSRRDVEGLEQEGADDERNDEGMDDDPDGLDDTTLFAFLFTGHAHRPSRLSSVAFRLSRPEPIRPRFRRACGLPAGSARYRNVFSAKTIGLRHLRSTRREAAMFCKKPGIRSLCKRL